MRKKGTRYKTIKALPANAMPVSQYADEAGIKVGTVYMAYKRYSEGYTTRTGKQSKGSDPNYIIRCYQGMNFVIPHK